MANEKGAHQNQGDKIRNNGPGRKISWEICQHNREKEFAKIGNFTLSEELALQFYQSCHIFGSDNPSYLTFPSVTMFIPRAKAPMLTIGMLCL